MPFDTGYVSKNRCIQGEKSKNKPIYTGLRTNNRCLNGDSQNEHPKSRLPNPPNRTSDPAKAALAVGPNMGLAVKIGNSAAISIISGGDGGIRTLDTPLERITV